MILKLQLSLFVKIFRLTLFFQSINFAVKPFMVCLLSSSVQQGETNVEVGF